MLIGYLEENRENLNNIQYKFITSLKDQIRVTGEINSAQQEKIEHIWEEMLSAVECTE